MRSDRIWSFSGPYFPAFRLNTERYGVSPRIQSERKKLRTKKTPSTDTFNAVSDWFCEKVILKNFMKFKEKHLRLSQLTNFVTGSFF